MLMPARDKQSTSLRAFVNYGGKNIYDIVPSCLDFESFSTQQTVDDLHITADPLPTKLVRLIADHYLFCATKRANLLLFYCERPGLQRD